jgi:hypothetical protein
MRVFFDCKRKLFVKILKDNYFIEEVFDPRGAEAVVVDRHSLPKYIHNHPVIVMEYYNGPPRDNIYVFNYAMGDLSIMNFANHLYRECITHIDIACYTGGHLSLDAEAANKLATVAEIVGYRAMTDINIRFSFNRSIHSVHISGYKNNFTMSIFITNLGRSELLSETIKVTTAKGEVFSMEGDSECTWRERYGAAIEFFMKDVGHRNRFRQCKMNSILSKFSRKKTS